ncbi:LysR family transcriptional regulator [Azospirillum sp. YIM B02556]|uniref:LysR family transcriptional regulator n=2 Tax=Azospirillum endophyticum TaxID=2800326 RepID=A0ABS1F419_9PROT|nr:LysR family transcriptional regulator [Azospirillum endophyticum]MBK1838160.1 LysR family transcriptional regulator [Azospirillum endophyticum]
MRAVDLNLLLPLDALLTERSVTGAARRLGLSPSAMSRTLARLRRVTGDPLLVQAGRGLVPTPYAEEISGQVHTLCRDVQAVLRPAAGRLDLASVHRTFTIRAGQSFVELLAAAVMAAVAEAAPHVRLRFVPKPDKEADPLRDGRVDLEIGVLGTSAPELLTQLLFRDRLVGVARSGHPILAAGTVTPERYAACGHVAASRRGEFHGPVDDALAELGLSRSVSLVVPRYPDAMRVAAGSDLIAAVPRSCLGNGLAADHAAGLGLESFDLPVRTAEFAISAIWHPRLQADPAHRWLRETIATVCRRAYPQE